MSILTRKTIQKLAVLHTLSLWKKGAYGGVRLHKTLFFADQKSTNQEWRLFTFKRYYLGQYSSEVADALNVLEVAGRVKAHWDGPAQRIEASIPPKCKPRIRELFDDYFPEWSTALKRAFKKWAYLSNDQILSKAHDDPTYTHSRHDEIIAESGLPNEIEFTGLDDTVAESLAELVDGMLANVLRGRLQKASESPRKAEDWRSVYFPNESVAG